MFVFAYGITIQVSIDTSPLDPITVTLLSPPDLKGWQTPHCLPSGAWSLLLPSTISPCSGVYLALLNWAHTPFHLPAPLTLTPGQGAHLPANTRYIWGLWEYNALPCMWVSHLTFGYSTYKHISKTVLCTRVETACTRNNKNWPRAT